MNILEQIIVKKRQEVTVRKRQLPMDQLLRATLSAPASVSFTESIRERSDPGIIAEFKRRSPSGGVINEHVSVAVVAQGYAQYGACALSVLTDTGFFGGCDEDLCVARDTGLPVLRKDFIIDAYQVAEACTMGAGAVLLIAAVLSKREVLHLSQFARQLGIQVLLEVHSEAELDHINPFVDAIGVNNRDLKTFVTDIRTSLDLVDRLPPELVKISESGIHTPAGARILRQAGYDALLIGTLFMQQPAPEQAFAAFASSLYHES